MIEKRLIYRLRLSPTIPLDFEGAAVRVVKIDGEPWFVAKDVAELLGYAAPRNAIRAHCKGGTETVLPSPGGQQTMTIIPERDVYRLVMRSKLPAAERFEEWVTGTVLPAIRKDGAYVMGEDEQPSFQVRVPVRSPSRSGRPGARRRGTVGAAHQRRRAPDPSTSEAAGPPFPGRRDQPGADAASPTALPWLANANASARADEDGDNVSRPTRRRTGPTSTTEGRSAPARRRTGRARRSPGTERDRQSVRGPGLRPHPVKGSRPRHP